MLLIIILTISVLTAVTQIASSLSDLRDPNKKGIGAITKAGVVFYICTVILAVLPAIQNLIQDSIAEEQKNEMDEAQEKRDEKLRLSYDSSLTEMKKKFDTTTRIVSETLAKYGFRLDESNKMLVSIKDSAKTRVYISDAPVLSLTSPPLEPGIQLVEKTNEIFKFKISIVSDNAGSAFFDIHFDMLPSNDSAFYTDPYWSLSGRFIEPTSRFATGAGIYAHYSIPRNDDFTILYLWINGTYKRLDGTGDFRIDELAAYFFKNQAVRIIKGETRKKVVSFLQNRKK